VPFITVEIMEGRSLDDIRRFAARVTDAAVECLSAAPENVRIRFVTLKPTELASGGELVADKRARAESNDTAA
jgi:4-oxalocrotonate tautomerase